jgi:hypothetical protein
MSDPTPTEWLVMEVLAARWRLGETTWHFPDMCKRTLKCLAERDWIAYKAATIEGYQQAWLRADGRLEWGLPRRGELRVDLNDADANLLLHADGSGALFDPPPPHSRSDLTPLVERQPVIPVASPRYGAGDERLRRIVEPDDGMDDPRNGIPLTPDPNRRRWWHWGRR